MDIQRLVIAEPSGNTTALVFDQIAPDQRRFVADLIQQDFPDVEQVMFVLKHGDRWHGQMAGREFCGNAARSLGYVLSNGLPSSQNFTMSGLTRAVQVDVSRYRATLKMLTAINIEKKLLNGHPLPVVHLEGISHAIITPEHKSFDELRSHAHILDGNPDHNPEIKAALDQLGLTNRLACGLLFVTKSYDVIDLKPYVYVPGTGKLYGETACASGSIAVARILGNDVRIRQPSGKTLRIGWSQKAAGLSAEVDGDMMIKFNGRVSDLGQASEAKRDVSSLLHPYAQLAARAG